MSDTKVDGRLATSMEARMVFQHLNEPKAFVRNGKAVGEEKFDATIVVTDDKDIAAIIAKAKAVALAKWPGVDLKTLKFPFSTGKSEAEKAKAKGKDGSIYPDAALVVKGRSNYQPTLSVWTPKGPEELRNLSGPALQAAKNKFYNGCFVAPSWTFVAYDPVNDGRAGVAAYLDKVMWYRDGERIGGQTTKEAFKHFQGSVSAEDPTGSALDDEIPF